MIVYSIKRKCIEGSDDGSKGNSNDGRSSSIKSVNGA
jgi:hypothetical protein